MSKHVIEIECVDDKAIVIETIRIRYSYAITIELPKDTNHIYIKLFEALES